VLGIGFLSTKDSGDVAGPIIVDGSEGGPALEVKEAYLLDNGNKTATFTQYAGESYEVESIIENLGDEAGTRTFDLVVGESVEDERTVELAPAENQTIYFMPNAPSVDSTTTLSIMLGDSAVGELVVEPRVDISVTGAFLLDGSGNRVSSRTLTEGEILDAEADLENAGIDSGDISLALELEGTQLDSATTTVGPDAGTVVQALSGEVPQVEQSTEYAATIADQSAGTVTVEPAPAIPEGVVHQYDFYGDFAQGDSTVADSVGSADISLTGDHQDDSLGTESGARGDGTGDHGLATADTIEVSSTFGIAISLKGSGWSGNQVMLGRLDERANPGTTIRNGNGTGIDGAIELFQRDDNSNDLNVSTSSTFDDGNPHAVIINKNGNDTSQIEFYVDDATTAENKTVNNNQAFDDTNYSLSTSDLGFWADNNGGSLANYIQASFGKIWLSTKPFTESERQSFIDKQPF
jgi:hypothetical protein